MNHLFQDLLRQYVIVFFDDILIYSHSKEQHQQHIAVVLDLLQQNSFYIQESKCSFGVSILVYLGHIISAYGVRTDLEKIRAVQDWPTPKSVWQVWVFLGLTGYYWHFIERYAQLAGLLIDLLRKDNFHWTERKLGSFNTLKEKLISTSVLAYSNFAQPFVIETDACNIHQSYPH